MTRHHLVCVGHPTYHTSDPRAERHEPFLCRHYTLSPVSRDVLALASMLRQTTLTSCVGAKKSSQSPYNKDESSILPVPLLPTAAEWYGQPISRVPVVRYPPMSVWCPL
jgi:hypothetical protein